MKHRLYIDEVGHSGIGKTSKHENRYLSLTGVAVELEYMNDVLQPQMEKMKREYFNYHIDEPIVLHRKEMINRKPPFDTLRDESIAKKFDRDLLDLLSKWDYTVFTVLLDKIEQIDRYKVYQMEPYHYCLWVLLERYQLWLENISAVGDVMAESRGGKEDRRLKASYNRLFISGTDYIPNIRFQERFTSCQLKIKSKANNIAGLQLADMIAYPSYKHVLAYYSRKKTAANFGTEIVEILKKNRYYSKDDGRIEGWGIKMLP